MINSKTHLLTLNKSGFILLLALFYSLGVQMCYARTTLRVESQKDFDGLKTSLLDHIARGEKNIVVDFTKGRYFYKFQHVYLAEKQFSDVSVKFKGNGSTIISSGKELKNDGHAVKYNKETGFIDANGDDYANYSCMFQSDSMVEILDERTKQCRIHDSDLQDVGAVNCSHAYIRLTSWFTSYLYPVSKISDGYVYFVADNLAPGYTQYGNYNVNYDYTVGKIFPRFRLINVPVGGCKIASTSDGIINRSGETAIHLCESGFFISFLNCTLKHLAIEGFNIIGCRADSQILRFRNLKAESIEIIKCSLSAARGMAIYADKTDNIAVSNCEFHDNYLDVISLSNSCTNATIKDNRFYNNGKGVRNSFCIVCRGGNYHITKNEIRDFNYGGIGVGVWHNASKGSLPAYGVVERNHIYYTSEYIADKASWTLVDGGAIYLWSKNDGTVVRNNFIHDYEGMGSNRGIYCDDGTSNCSIYGNIILNIGNCYSIDLRRSLLLDKLNIGLRSNVNNRIYGNVFNNRFRFQGRTDDSTSFKGGNTILIEDENNMPRIIEDNLNKESDDKFETFNQRKWYKRGQRLVR